MIPVEVGEPSFRRQHFHEESNNASLRAELDVLDEAREKAQIVAEACNQRMTRRFNSSVKPRTFHEGNLVWRATGSARRNSSEGKLSANWDDPFLDTACPQQWSVQVRRIVRQGHSSDMEFYSFEDILQLNQPHVFTFQLCVMMHSFP
uniref:Uncharacterized protein n=1 Tax=Cajanus cajan TaxID=3821 RepID=A0A151TIP3_CAJCA|nr:hypothetical protein KK1_013239 [Cajanus cajan]